MRGRKPIPTELAKIKGFYRPSRHKDQVGMAGIEFVYGTIPDAPEGLNEYAKQLWVEQLTEAAKVNGFIAVLDLGVFELYCKIYGDLMELRNQCRGNSVYYKDNNGIKRVNPIYKEQKNLAKEFTKLSAEFGFTPSARTRVTLQSIQEQEQELEDYTI